MARGMEGKVEREVVGQPPSAPVLMVGSTVRPRNGRNLTGLAPRGRIRSLRVVRGRTVCLVHHECGRLRNWYLEDLQLSDAPDVQAGPGEGRE